MPGEGGARSRRGVSADRVRWAFHRTQELQGRSIWKPRSEPELGEVSIRPPHRGSVCGSYISLSLCVFS